MFDASPRPVGFKARSTSGQSAGRRSSPEKMRSDELEIHPDSIRHLPAFSVFVSDVSVFVFF